MVLRLECCTILIVPKWVGSSETRGESNQSSSIVIKYTRLISMYVVIV